MLVLFSYQLVDDAEFLAFYKMIKIKLPQSLHQKVDSFKFIADKQRSLMADLLVRYFYADKLGVKWSQIEYYYNEHDKPSLKEVHGHFFNISHSGNQVVVAFSDQELGVDVEKIKGDRRKIAQRFFTSLEIDQLEMAGDDEEQMSYFYQLWTLKESYMKAIGKGMTMSLSSFAFEKKNDQFQLAFSSNDRDWFFHTPKWADGYYMSICSKIANEPVLKVVSMQEIGNMLG